MGLSLRKARLELERLGTAGFYVLAVAGWLLLPAFAPRPSFAGTGAVMHYPLGNIKAVNGLQMSISSHWIEGNGYRPVTFEFTCLPKANADRRLNVSFSPNGWGAAGQAENVQFEVEIPQGSTRVSKTVAVPQNEIWYQWKVSVYEEGRRLKELSATTGIPRRTQSWGWTEAYPTMLFIDRDAPSPSIQGPMVNRIQAQGSGGQATTNKLPNIRAMARFFAPHNNYQQQLTEAVGSSVPTDKDILVMIQNLSTIEMLPPSDLPVEWINYTCADMVFVSLEDLQLTAQQQPDRWSALRQYISTGGNLVVYGVGAKFEKLPELEQLLNLPSVDAADQVRNQRFPGWKDPSQSRYGLGMNNIFPAGEYVTSYRNGRMVRQSYRGQAESRSRSKGEIPPAMFASRELGMGRVVAVGPEDAFAEDEEQWNWFFADLGPDRYRWYRRNGVSAIRENDDFWDFLIPDEGAAPVKTFLAIITGFMIMIGPVNYWLLRKWKRLYLLLVTVPLGAGLITVCLFAYALLIDGLGTRTRIRSFTEIDSRSNAAVSWSRQSYYAGLAPSGGLVFPKTTAIYPIDFSPMGGRGPRRLVRWGSAQNLASGYVGARRMSQLMVINAAPANGQIVVNRRESGVTAVNQLEVVVSHLVVADNDRFYWAEQIAPNQTVKLEPQPREEILDRLGELRSEHRPMRPNGFVSPRSSRRFYYINTSDDQYAAPSVLTSILERRMSSLSLSASDENRIYIAITSEAPSTVPVGVSDADQKAGFHVIKGTW